MATPVKSTQVVVCTAIHPHNVTGASITPFYGLVNLILMLGVSDAANDYKPSPHPATTRSRAPALELA